ncbi:MAG: S8 family peptidase [Candidatus Omnitrophota bacterium]|jgi:hypothetical protein
MENQGNDKRGSEQERLFIKVILPHQGMERKNTAGGTKPKPFRVVDDSFRKSLSVRIKAINVAVTPVIKKIGVAPARVKLTPKAFAKSHRPETIFSAKTCPIIGAGKLGELFIKVSPQGLGDIDNMILTEKSEKIVKEISTIENIEPITPEFRLSGNTFNDILRFSPKIQNEYMIKVQLFDFGKTEDQENLKENFFEECRIKKIPISKMGYSDESSYFVAMCKNESDIEKIANIIGVRSIKQMPIFRYIKRQGLNTGGLPTLPEPIDSLRNYPIVAVVDSGITDQISSLNKWIVGRESEVAPAYRNPQHGTFVAGLICWANELNPDLKNIDSSPCAVFDLQVIPNGDPDKGDIDSLTETQLLQDLETALKKHSNEIKVWNLSLGSNEPCSLDYFSAAAVELDRLQEKYNVSFVISAGNYEDFPLLNYPRKEEELAKGRITSPADSVLAITVGSVAHKSHAANGPKEGEPSPFSRHGAGPNYIIKPDLVHYGGSCDIHCKEAFGVCSIDGKKICEDLGTSFSTPIVSRLLANIYHHIVPAPSPVLARAILTHHAHDPRTGNRVPDEEVNFLGFGIPNILDNCLECSPWASTLVFQDFLRPGYYLEWDNFPYPNSLTKDGKYYGDIRMTVAFAPVRNEKWGTEYCETHVEAHMGVYHKKKSRDGRITTIKFKGLVPPEHDVAEEMYESYQVKNLRKWAPVRTYFGSLGPNGITGDRWRLKVRLLTRHSIEDDETIKPQPFALILTISDPNLQAAVYNDMAVNIRARFQAENLMLRATTQVRARQQG